MASGEGYTQNSGLNQICDFISDSVSQLIEFVLQFQDSNAPAPPQIYVAIDSVIMCVNDLIQSAEKVALAYGKDGYHKIQRSLRDCIFNVEAVIPDLYESQARLMGAGTRLSGWHHLLAASKVLAVQTITMLQIVYGAGTKRLLFDAGALLQRLATPAEPLDSLLEQALQLATNLDSQARAANPMERDAQQVAAQLRVEVARILALPKADQPGAVAALAGFLQAVVLRLEARTAADPGNFEPALAESELGNEVAAANEVLAGLLAGVERPPGQKLRGLLASQQQHLRGLVTAVADGIEDAAEERLSALSEARAGMVARIKSLPDRGEVVAHYREFEAGLQPLIEATRAVLAAPRDPAAHAAYTERVGAVADSLGKMQGALAPTDLPPYQALSQRLGGELLALKTAIRHGDAAETKARALVVAQTVTELVGAGRARLVDPADPVQAPARRPAFEAALQAGSEALGSVVAAAKAASQQPSAHNFARLEASLAQLAVPLAGAEAASGEAQAAALVAGARLTAGLAAVETALAGGDYQAAAELHELPALVQALGAALAGLRDEPALYGLLRGAEGQLNRLLQALAAQLQADGDAPPVRRSLQKMHQVVYTALAPLTLTKEERLVAGVEEARALLSHVAELPEQIPGKVAAFRRQVAALEQGLGGEAVASLDRTAAAMARPKRHLHAALKLSPPGLADQYSLTITEHTPASPSAEPAPAAPAAATLADSAAAESAPDQRVVLAELAETHINVAAGTLAEKFERIKAAVQATVQRRRAAPGAAPFVALAESLGGLLGGLPAAGGPALVARGREAAAQVRELRRAAGGLLQGAHPLLRQTGLLALEKAETAATQLKILAAVRAADGWVGDRDEDTDDRLAVAGAALGEALRIIILCCGTLALH